MRAIILAGGKGTRLRPYTTLVPKPLVPIGGERSILEIVIQQLARCGFDHLTLAVNHLANLIRAYFGDGSQWNIKIDYSLEPKPLSTIGPLTLIGDLPDNFLVMNGDILSNLDYARFFHAHVEEQSEISVAVCNRVSKVDYGVLKVDGEAKVAAFIEKPSYEFDVSMGVYCLNRSVINALPKGEPYGFDQLMIDSIKAGRKIRASRHMDFWLDIGRPDDYDYANENYGEIQKRLGI